MTGAGVRAAAERLVDFHERFAPLFGKEQAQDHADTSVQELMVRPERKSVEPIALNVGDGQVSALQKFLTIAPWDDGDVQTEAGWLGSVFGPRFTFLLQGTGVRRRTPATLPVRKARGSRRQQKLKRNVRCFLAFPW